MFLGFIVSERGVSVDPQKVRAIVTWPRLGSMHDIQSFIELAAFYHHFIRDFSSVTAPLTDCLKKETFLWTEAAEQALKYLHSQGKLSDRHARWVEYLHDFTFVLRHKKGKENVMADELSRRVHLLNLVKVQVT